MQDGTGQVTALWERISETPLAFDVRFGADRLAELDAIADGTPGLGTLLAREPVRALLIGTLGSSPYLAGLILRDPSRLTRILASAPETHLAQLGAQLDTDMASAAAQADAMRILRRYKTEVALLVALADLGGAWPVMTVTAALSDAADATTRATVRFLFRAAIAKGDWLGGDGDMPEANSGYIVLGMGKHGARELNYSSDIDLIVFYEPDLVRLRLGVEPLAFFVRMTRDLVRLMQERTGDPSSPPSPWLLPAPSMRPARSTTMPTSTSRCTAAWSSRSRTWTTNWWPRPRPFSCTCAITASLPTSPRPAPRSRC